LTLAPCFHHQFHISKNCPTAFFCGINEFNANNTSIRRHIDIDPLFNFSFALLLKNILFRNVFDIPAAAGWQFDLNSWERNSDQELCAFVCSVRKG